MAEPLKMDKAGLQGFVDNQLAPFEKGLKHVADDDDEFGVTMDSLLGTGHVNSADRDIYQFQAPLPIGHLRSDKGSGGTILIGKITDSAQSISDVFVKQVKLFGDLHTNLNNTITKLMNGQHDSLEKIDGKIFLDGLGTVPGDFQGPNSSS
jgi:hypothetical protein